VLRIVLCEREIASSARPAATVAGARAVPILAAKLERMARPGVGHRMYRAMQQTVRRGRQGRRGEGIDCHWAKGGTVQFARSMLRWRASHEWHEARLYGFDEGPTCDCSQRRRHIRSSAMTDVLGQCAARIARPITQQACPGLAAVFAPGASAF